MLEHFYYMCEIMILVSTQPNAIHKQEGLKQQCQGKVHTPKLMFILRCQTQGCDSSGKHCF